MLDSNLIMPLVLASAICAAIYGFALVLRPPSGLRTIVKAIPVSALALVSSLAGGPPLLTFALGFGAIGDVFLSREGQRNFLLGLASFLVGHICFAALFYRLGAGGDLLASEPWRLGAVIGLALFAAFMAVRLYPNLKELALPVMAYICVIFVMGLSALTISADFPLGLVISGAALFIASDAILAFDLFIIDRTSLIRKIAAPALWFLYWGGQILIAAAIVLN